MIAHLHRQHMAAVLFTNYNERGRHRCAILDGVSFFALAQRVAWTVLRRY
jgi:hypothetical protein